MGFQANGQGMGWPAVGTGVGTEVPRQAQVQKKAVTIDVNRMIDGKNESSPFFVLARLTSA